MNAITSVIKRHSLVTFFALAIAISWGSYYILSGPFLFPFGSILAALIVASVTAGRNGLKDLASRCLRWNVGLKWYAAVLFVPAVIGLATVWLNVLLGAPVPTAAQLGPWYSLFLMFPMAIFDAPLWEEVGWRGYALPRFSANRSPLVNTLILGVLLAVWHLPIALSGGALAVPYLAAAIASAVVTNWVYYNTRGSALLAILYHSAANTVGLFFSPALSGPDLTRYFWLLAAVNIVAAALVILLTGTSLQRRSIIQTRIAPVDKPSTAG
jgi:membrane protease YdiL (CAAX protease family)